MCSNPQETADLVTFTEEILNGKFHFLCNGWERRIQVNTAEWRKDVNRRNERRKCTFEFEQKDLD